MNGQSLFGFLVSMAVLFLVVSFAITLLPYILLGFLIWYLYKRLLKPLFSGASESGNQKKESNYYKSYTAETRREEEPVVNQVKSVHDDTFFAQEHKVVDVEYDDDNE